MEIHQLRGPLGSTVHLLTRSSHNPESIAVAAAGDVLLVDVDRNIRAEHLDADASDVSVISCAQTTILAIAHAKGVTVVREGNGRRESERLGGHDGRATGVALFGAECAPTWVVSADERGNVLRWDVRARTRPARERVHRKAVSRLVATRLADGRDAFLTFSDDREILIHVVSTGEVVARLSAHAGWVEQAVPISRGGVLWGVAAADRVGLTIWEAETGHAVGRVPGKAAADISACWHPTKGACVSFITPDGLVLWSAAGTNSITRPGRGRVRASAVAVSPSGQLSVVAAVEDAMFHSDGQTEFVDAGVRFPAAVVRWLPWSSVAGALVVLVDGSLWDARW